MSSPGSPARKRRAAPSLPAGPGRQAWLWASAAVLLSVLVFAPTLRFGFVYDDVPQILQNREVQARGFQPEFFTGHLWQHLFPQWTGNYYRPFFLLWIQANFLLFGSSAVWWHAECIAIHAIATLLVFRLAQRLQAPPPQAFLAAALFAVLPIHAEVVAWISGADESLACVLLLGAFLCWLRARDGGGRGRWWYAAAIGLFAAAELMKENAVVLPALVFLYEWLLGKGARTGLRRSVPFVLAVGAYFAARMYALSGIAGNEHPPSALSTVSTLPSVVWFYAVRLVLPFGTSLMYEVRRLWSPSFYGFLVPLLQCVGVVGICVVAARASRRAAFLLAGIATVLLPMLAAIPVFADHELVHDRYLYTPSTFFTVLLAMSLWRAGARLPRGLAASLTAVGLGLLWLGTMSASYPWRDTVELFRHATQAAPNNPRARLFLADELSQRGRPKEAIALYNQVLVADPDSAYGLVGLGRAHFALGEFAEAEHTYQRAETAVAREQPSSTVFYLLGMTENRLAKYPEAERYLHKAIALHPRFSRYHYELALALKGQGKLPEAREALRTELSIYPASPGARELLREIGG